MHLQAPKKEKKADPGKNPAKAATAKKGAGAKKKVRFHRPVLGRGAVSRGRSPVQLRSRGRRILIGRLLCVLCLSVCLGDGHVHVLV